MKRIGSEKHEIIYLESPANPTMKLVDIEAMVRLACRVGAKVYRNPDPAPRFHDLLPLPAGEATAGGDHRWPAPALGGVEDAADIIAALKQGLDRLTEMFLALERK